MVIPFLVHSRPRQRTYGNISTRQETCPCLYAYLNISHLTSHSNRRFSRVWFIPGGDTYRGTFLPWFWRFNIMPPPQPPSFFRSEAMLATSSFCDGEAFCLFFACPGQGNRRHQEREAEFEYPQRLLYSAGVETRD